MSQEFSTKNVYMGIAVMHYLYPNPFVKIDAIYID